MFPGLNSVSRKFERLNNISQMLFGLRTDLKEFPSLSDLPDENLRLRDSYEHLWLDVNCIPEQQRGVFVRDLDDIIWGYCIECGIKVWLPLIVVTSGLDIGSMSRDFSNDADVVAYIDCINPDNNYVILTQVIFH